MEWWVALCLFILTKVFFLLNHKIKRRWEEGSVIFIIFAFISPTNKKQNKKWQIPPNFTVSIGLCKMTEEPLPYSTQQSHSATSSFFNSRSTAVPTLETITKVEQSRRSIWISIWAIQLTKNQSSSVNELNTATIIGQTVFHTMAASLL